MTGLFQCKPINQRWKKFQKILFAGKFANKLLVTQRLAHNVGSEGGGRRWVERRQNIINTTEIHWHQTDWSALGKQVKREL